MVRSGGFAGVTRVWSTQISAEEAEKEWLPLLHEPLPEEPGGPDRFVYEITVGPAAVTLPEHCVQGRWRDLVERARQGSGKDGAEGGGENTGQHGEGSQ